jgi:stage II sporulation protein B
MDRPKVSIKINGRERSFYEATSDKRTKDDDPQIRPIRKHEIPSITEKKNQSSVQDEPGRANEEIAAAKEDREFDWILPQQDKRFEEIHYDPIVSMDELRKKRKPMLGSFSFPSKMKKRKNHDKYPIKTLLLSIISALVIGTSFGMMVLHLFSGEIGTPAGVATTPTETVNNPSVGGAEEGAGGNQNPTASINLPALNVFVVQGGVYSSVENATPIVEQIKEEGFAGTIVNQDEKYFIFLGIGVTDLAGKAIKAPYEEQVQGTFVKALSTAEINAVGDPSLLEARQLFDQLVTYSSNLYTSMPESVAWEEIKQSFEQIGSKETGSTEASFIQSVKAAYPIVETYKSSTSDQNFWATQQALLNSYQLYQNWVLEQKK